MHADKGLSHCSKIPPKKLSASALCPSAPSSAVRPLETPALGGAPLSIGFPMKWFKHQAVAVKDEKIQLLMDEFGTAGYAIFFILLELCAEKLDEKLNPEIKISWPYIERLTHSRRSTVRQVASRCASVGLLVAEVNDLELICKIPNLLKNIDETTRKFRNRSRLIPDIDKEQEQERDRDRERENRHIPPVIDDVKTYFTEIEIPLQAEAFFDHFSSNGWRIGGKTQMRDWKAAARNWKRNIGKFDGNRKQRERKPFPVNGL